MKHRLIKLMAGGAIALPLLITTTSCRGGATAVPVAPIVVTPVAAPSVASANPQADRCPDTWTATLWVSDVQPEQVEDIKVTAKSDAVFCQRFVGNTDSEKESEVGVMVKVDVPDISAALPQETITFANQKEAAEHIAKTEAMLLDSGIEPKIDATLKLLEEVGYKVSVGSLG